MGLLHITNVTHWSIPVNNLDEAEHFYRDVLGLEYQGRLGNSNMACVTVAGHSILLCQRNEPVVRTPAQDNRLHHSFEVSSAVFEQACKLFQARGIPIVDLVYREHGFFPGRELYFLDPSNNLLELRDPGIGLRRDNLVSVMYAEELNSGESSVTLQRTDRHGSMGQKFADFQVSS